MHPLPATLPELLDRSALTYPRKTALAMRGGLRDDRWSYERLRARSHAIAAATAQLGLERGDRVLFQAPNSPELVAAMFGCLRAGLVLVPLDLQAPAEQINAIARLTEAAAVISPDSRPAPPGARHIPLEQFRGAPAATFHASPLPGDLAEIVFTSGTTGHPKGVMLTHGNIASNVRSAGVLPHGPSHRLVSLLPLSHMLEQTGGLFFPLSGGGSIAYATSRQSTAVLRELRARRPTTLVVVPQILERLLGSIEQELERRGRLSHWRSAHRIAPRLPIPVRRALFLPVHQALGGSLRWVFCGGAALSPSVQAAWERLGVTVMQGYGATECAPFVSCNRPGECTPGSIGRPLPSIETRLDADGELLVRGPNVTPGYWRDETTSAEVLVDGWYRTGDLATAGEPGGLYLLGRKRELIALPNGMNVFPSDVEAELLAQPMIKQAAVVGWSSSGAPAVHAVMVPVDNAGETELVAAVRAANGQLASHLRITGWTVWPEPDLPRTSSLKVRKQVIIDWLSQHQTAPVPLDQPGPGPASRPDQLIALLRKAAPQSAIPITADTDLASELGLDSLARVELAVAIEQGLGVQLSDEAIARAATVADLQRLLESGSEPVPTGDFPSWPWAAASRLTRNALQRAILFPLVQRWCQPLRLHGTDAMERTSRPCLIIANHTSHLDAALVLRALPDAWRARTAVAAAKDYFFRDRWLGTMASLAIGAFPLAREGPILPSLEYCGRLIDKGWSVLVFPEGTRSPDGRLQPFKPGIGLLARELRVPILPIAIRGADRVLPKGSSWPRSGPVTVGIGDPITIDPRRSPDEIGRLLREQLAQMLDRDAKQRHA